ncbi:RNA binding metal dependent phosphohydrolase [Thermanaerovibrio acidaminovorans DSM 6589]|uniref:Ribonuclease Y n=1 Tax=Thermanaerovibrio acidaminovorans (strain ATCC 49978 / DSM 6589 / Su883) TaxID=525903 RepID=D1B652_THEAS|nr:ribonuclease Y [Thermanaerovibrio acidaminovorans]ACZ19493.1 RNA binding metal dependent phosphohydrolase [Thermanaerovibrio acidaminovorans DSM 6589]
MSFVMMAAGAALGAAVVFLLLRHLDAKRNKDALSEAERVLKEAAASAERSKREMLTEAKEEILRLRQEVERETKERRSELQRAERRLEQKEEALDRRLEALSKREEDLKARQRQLEERMESLSERESQITAKLEEVASLTREEARDLLLKQVEDEAAHLIGLRLKEMEERARRESDRKAREIIATAIQRCSAEHTSEVAVSVVPLPSDEMKGRIIGREGRNIRTFETLTGVDLIVDDTPEAVTISCFDPVRREVARLALERLVADGRIHPARIEEIIEKAQRDVEEEIVEAGEGALLQTGIKSMNPELIRILGQLKFRFSYGQNALQHSLEVAYLTGIMASELGLDEILARRAGLLHDIGKAVDHQVEGPHAAIGADLARRYGEPHEVVNAIASHHEDEEPTTIYAVLVAAADAISASRPGARRESLDAYVKRLEKLESLAKEFSGVSKAFAIQAGREVRVAVSPQVTDDGAMQKLAYDIARKIEQEMKYPGQIKVTLIRETRAVEYAK